MTRLLLDAARFPWGEKGAAVSGESGAAAPPPLVLSGPDHHYLTRVLRHRLGLRFEAEAQGIDADKVVAQSIQATPVE